MKINLKQKIKNNSGSALIFSLITLSVMLVIAIGSFSISVINQQSGNATDKSVSSFQAADTGVEIVMKKIRSANSGETLRNEGFCSDGENLYTETIDGRKFTVNYFDASDIEMDCDIGLVSQIAKIKSTGEFMGTSRAVEVNVIKEGLSLTCYTLDGLAASFITNGENMDGMQITATFNDGTPEETVTWNSAGPDSKTGSAAGTGWSLEETDDTYYAYWFFTGADNISSILIDAGAGNAVFDTYYGNNEYGTPASAKGLDFELLSWPTPPWTLDGEYSGLVAVGGLPAVGDIYRYLKINFSNFSGSGSGSFDFRADTDTLKTEGDIYCN